MCKKEIIYPSRDLHKECQIQKTRVLEEVSFEDRLPISLWKVWKTHYPQECVFGVFFLGGGGIHDTEYRNDYSHCIAAFILD